MTKRKNRRLKHQKDVLFADTSDEELSTINAQGKNCPHITRGVHLSRVKKALKSSQSILSCCVCSDENIDAEPEEIWLCLQCGYRGCGRTSEYKHALQHFKTVHSDCHSLVLSTSSGSVWCYDCDDDVNLQSSQILKQGVEFIMKIILNSNRSNVASVDKSGLQKNLQSSVIKEEIVVQNSDDKKPVEKLKKPVKNSKEVSQKIPIKGLRNLGNTCFFNAVMQNLNQTPLLFHELKNTCESSYIWEIPELFISNNEITESTNSSNLKLSLPRQLPLANSLLKFLEQMNALSSTKVDVINPTPLFGEISKKCPQFRHFQQQDSHELLRQLLDGVRLEEIKRQKKAILRYFDLENVSPECVDEEMKEKVKAYGSYASHTIIEKIFGGLLISTVLCEECKMSSQVFEPFMDLSLPLFEEKPLRNRKADWGSDENVSGEFILSKPKNDPGKPSKYQEKKQKQLTKKEKKRTKSARNRKNSSSGLYDNSADVRLHESIDGANENEEENSIVDNEGNEDCGVMNSVKSDEENFVENTNISIEIQEPDEELKDEATENCIDKEDSQVNIDNKDFSTCPILEASANTEEIVSEVHKSVEGERNENSILEKSAEPLDFRIAEEKESDNDEGYEEAEEGFNDESNHDDSLQGLTEDVSSHLKIAESSHSLIDDRIQAVSMQVKDIRIRRDSDRQDNLLNSSESGEESQMTNCTSPKSSVEDTCSIENGDNWSHLSSEQQIKDWISKTLTTLKPRHHVSPLECSIHSCLSHFTKPELLTGNNKFRCENCTELKIKKTGNKKEAAYSNASKQMLIFSPPAILTLHLKRFQQVGLSLRKVNRFVEFPLILDLAPFCCSACSILPHMSSVEDEILYSLYGVVEHSGRLTSGHYTAYVKANKRTVNRTFECQLPLAQCNLEQLLHKFSGVNEASSSGSCEKSKEESCQWFYISDSHVKEVSEAQVLKCQAYLLFYERIK